MLQSKMPLPVSCPVPNAGSDHSVALMCPCRGRFWPDLRVCVVVCVVTVCNTRRCNWFCRQCRKHAADRAELSVSAVQPDWPVIGAAKSI